MTDAERITIPANLNAEFERTGYTNDELARIIGTTERTVRRWRKGITVPRSRQLRAMGEVFGRDWRWFFADNDHEDDRAAA